jgi:protein-disulfide isomerase
VTIPGIDTSALTPREKKEWSGYVGSLLAPCSDVPVSIAQCAMEKRSCAKCVPAAKYILKAVRDGMSQEQVEKSYHNRFDPDKIRSVDVGTSPVKGPVGAPITLIEFADFECPFCAAFAPVLEQVVTNHQSDVRFVYKFMPLSGHPHGEPAARAAIAALVQGKFWEMHDKLFANREHLEQSDLDSYAKDLGLDLSRFHTDMQSQATTDRLAADRKQADALDVKGTPTIYVNGREVADPRQTEEWIIQEEGGDSKPSASSAGSPLAPNGAGDAGIPGADAAPKK